MEKSFCKCVLLSLSLLCAGAGGGWAQSYSPVYYNPFVFRDNKKWQNFTVMPGICYRLPESYVNGFIGANLIGSKYNPIRSPFPLSTCSKCIRL